MTLKYSNISHPQYKEAEALNQLLQTADKTLAEMNESYESTEDYDYLDQQITITIGGVSTAILFGGPQMQALCDFIETIATENGYDVNFKESTVQE